MNMPRFLPLVLVCAGLLVITGCCRRPLEVVVIPPPVIIPPVIDKPVIDKPVIDKPVIEKPVIDKPVIEKPPVPPELQEATAKLNVRVSVNDNAGGGKLAQSINRQLANAGFTIIPTAGPELTVSVDATSELFDRSGNYYVYKGTATTELRCDSDRKVLAGGDVDVKGARKLGKEAARTDLRRKFADHVVQWVTANVLPKRVGIAAAELTLTMTRCKSTKRGDQAEIKRFIRSVLAIRGVVACRQVGDPPRRVYQFRAIYYPEEIPLGLAKAAAEACGYRLR